MKFLFLIPKCRQALWGSGYLVGSHESTDPCHKGYSFFFFFNFFILFIYDTLIFWVEQYFIWFMFSTVFVACYETLTMKLTAVWSVKTWYWDLLCNAVCVCLCVVCRLGTQIQPQADVSARFFSLSQCRLLRYFYACCTMLSSCCWQALMSCFLR